MQRRFERDDRIEVTSGPMREMRGWVSCPLGETCVVTLVARNEPILVKVPTRYLRRTEEDPTEIWRA